MSGAVRRPLDDGRWHFQHGPIDCIVLAEGEAPAVADCVERAWSRFRLVLDELVGELPALRSDLSAHVVGVSGSVARRMVAACAPLAADGRFLTAMAAVAGSVADELIAAFDDPRIRRACVNNGGDIALHLSPEAAFDVGVVAGMAALVGRFRVDSRSPIRGVATSGWRGRSFSLGIADSVTVLATSAALADAAATIVANAVDIDAGDARVSRAPASSVRDDSDLGDRLVVRGVAALPEALVQAALAHGAAEARAQIGAGRIIAAMLSLQGRHRACGARLATLRREEIAA